MFNTIRHGLIASIIGMGLFAGHTHAAVAPPTTYSDLVIFGDSLSDTGNVLSLTTLYGPAPFPSYPGAAGRFSNGPAWTEYLASGLGFASSAAPSNRFYNGTDVIPIGPLGGKNYSFGGARTGLDGSAGANTGLAAQLIAWDNATSILTGNPQLTSDADPDALYVIMAGANDLRDIRSANSALDPASVQARAAEATQVAQNVAGALGLLANAGARHFLLSNLPDLGLTPEATTLNRVAASSDVTISFNSALSSLVGSFEAGFNQTHGVDLDIRTMDFFGLFNEVFDDAANQGGAAFGITNVTSACLSPGFLSNQYFFFDATASGCNTAAFSDELHPSARAHELLGALAVQTATAPIPEPAEYAMLLAGLLVIGAAVRRRAGAKAA